ncbi:hypothetical protein [Streptomyces luteogriseus]|uniref:hypothetical protein n=1 Tax=Streptomyces luteogriseus TaxID=68233 RepID=UPI0037AB2A82
MTDDFASAMVTVLPVILLVATVQFNELGKRAEETNRRLTTEALQDGWNEARYVQQVERSPLIRRLKGLQAWWWTVLTLHVMAEVYLVFWLADDGRPAQPAFAMLVATVACLGFVTIAMEIALMTLAATGEEIRRQAAMRARFDHARGDQ